MATHSKIPAWKIPWIEKPGGPQPQGHKESDTTKQLSTNNLDLVILTLLYSINHQPLILRHFPSWHIRVWFYVSHISEITQHLPSSV